MKRKIKIINKLVIYKIRINFRSKIFTLSPGNFIKFNYICKEYNIFHIMIFRKFNLLLNLYKKNKDIIFINMIFFILILF